MKNEFKNFKFAADVSSMSDYMNANADLLLSRIILDTTEAANYQVIPNIKHAELVPIFESGNIDTLGYKGNGCSTFTGGTETMSEVELKVSPYTFEKSYCEAELNSTILSIRMRPGSYNIDLPSLTEAFMTDLSKKANVFISRKFWGATSSADGFSGVIEQLQSASCSATTNNITYTAMTPSNAISVADAYIQAIPAALKSVPTILAVSHSDFQAYALALRNSNLFQYNPETLKTGVYEIQVPFTATKIVATEIGSAGSYAVISTSQGLMMGTDLLSDLNGISWISQDFSQLRMKVVAKVGAAVPFCDEVVFAS
jgi:hypothetical protein